jgi:capsular polysaccharide biosynthesis protein
MRQLAPKMCRSIWIIRRHGALVGIAIAVGLLAGAVCAAFSPVMVSSTALVRLPASDVATAAVVARSDPVLTGALLRGSPAASLEALRGEVQVKSLPGDVLSVSASARTAARAEAIANTVADSYVGYIRSPGSSAVRVQEQLLEPATTATGLVPPAQVLIGAVLGLVSGALVGVIAALARDPADIPGSGRVRA